MEQVMNIEKSNEFNFIKKKVEEITNRWSQSLVNAKSPCYLKQKIFDFVYETQPDYILSFSFKHGDVLLVCGVKAWLMQKALVT